MNPPAWSDWDDFAERIALPVVEALSWRPTRSEAEYFNLSTRFDLGFPHHRSVRASRWPPQNHSSRQRPACHGVPVHPEYPRRLSDDLQTCSFSSGDSASMSQLVENSTHRPSFSVSVSGASIDPPLAANGLRGNARRNRLRRQCRPDCRSAPRAGATGWYSPSGAVKGHEEVPSGGHENCPVVATRSARSWPPESLGRQVKAFTPLPARAWVSGRTVAGGLADVGVVHEPKARGFADSCSRFCEPARGGVFSGVRVGFVDGARSSGVRGGRPECRSWRFWR